jgi:hypothetical protein
VPPISEAGPLPTLLNAITLTKTAVPFAKLNGLVYNVLIGIIQLALAITD